MEPRNLEISESDMELRGNITFNFLYENEAEKRIHSIPSLLKSLSNYCFFKNLEH